MSSKYFKFSVITVCKNAEKLIEETLLSVCKQSVFNNQKHNVSLQYIIIDGGSDDKTNYLIKTIIKKYENFKNFDFTHIIETDEGLYDGLSKGLKLTNGDVTSYINAGDFYNSTAFEIVYSILTENKDIKWLTGGKFLYNDKSHVTSFSIPYKYRPELIKTGFYGKYLPFIQQESTFWKTEISSLIDINQLKKLKLSGDLFLWHCFSKKHEIYIVNSYLCGFKFHENQLTFKSSNSTKEYILESKKFCENSKFYHFLLLLIDLPFWVIFKYYSKLGSIFNRNQIDFDRKKNSWISKKNLNKDYIYCWACDFNINRGEGILAFKFINKIIKKNYIAQIKSPRRNENIILSNQNISNDNFLVELNKLNLNFYEKYITPFKGILFLNYHNLIGNKTCYLNFLPLWNFFIFLFLPKKTLLGPITGSLFTGKVENIETFLRKFVMPTLFKISLKICEIKNIKAIFSTENLKKFVEENSKQKFYYNIAFSSDLNKKNILIKDFEKRKFDFCLYYRKHPNKNNFFLISLIKLLSVNFKIVVIGDDPKLNSNNIIYSGMSTRDKIEEIYSDSKYAIASGENFMSFFVYDCLTHGVRIFYNMKSIVPEILKNKDSIYKLDYSNLNDSVNKINNIVNQNINNIGQDDFIKNQFDIEFDNYLKNLEL